MGRGYIAVGQHNLDQLMVASKVPYREDELSPDVPENLPPTEMPGNSMTTSGTMRNLTAVLATSASMRTLGSTRTVFYPPSMRSTWLSDDVSTVLLCRRCDWRVLLVDPW